MVRLDRLTPMLSVSDLGRTMAFYCDRLGFRCIASFGDPHPAWCHLVRDGVDLMFNQPPAEEMAEVPLRSRDFQIFYFFPDDVAALHAAWFADGLPVTDLRVADYDMREFELRDPDGIWLWFGQSTRRSSGEPAAAQE